MQSTILREIETREAKDRSVLFPNLAPEEDEVVVFSAPESNDRVPQHQTTVSLVQQPLSLSLQLEDLWFERETVFIPHVIILGKSNLGMETTVYRIPIESEAVVCCLESEKKVVHVEKTTPLLEVQASVFVTDSLYHEKEAVFRPQEYSICFVSVLSQATVLSFAFDSHEVTLVRKPVEAFKTQDRNVLLLRFASEEEDVGLLSAPECKEHVHRELASLSIVNYQVSCGIESQCILFESERDLIPQQVSVIKPVLLFQATVFSISFEENEASLIQKTLKTSKVQDRLVVITNFVPEEEETTILLLPKIREKSPSTSASLSFDIHPLFSSTQFDLSIKDMVQFTPSRITKKRSALEVEMTVIRVPVKVEEVVFSVSSEKRPVIQNQAAVTRVFNVLTSLIVCDQVSCEKEAVFSPSPTDSRKIRGRQTMIPFRIPEVVEDLVLKKETQVNKVIEKTVAKEVVYFPAKQMSIQLESSPLLQFSETTATERAKVKETVMTTKGVAQVIEDKIPFERSSEFALASVPSKKASSSTGVLSVKAVVQEEKQTFDSPSDRMKVSMERIESRRTSLPTVYEEVATEESELYSKPLESVSAMESVFVPAKRTSVQLETSPFTEISTTKPFERRTARSFLTATTKQASLSQDSTQFEICRQLIPGQMQRKQALSTKSFTQMKAVMNTDTTVFTLASDQSELMLSSSQSRRSSLFPVYEEPVTVESMSTHQKLTTQLAHPLVSPSRLASASLESHVREFGETSEQKSITKRKMVPTTDLTLQFSCISSEETSFEKDKEFLAKEITQKQVKSSRHHSIDRMVLIRDHLILENASLFTPISIVSFKSTEHLQEAIVSSASVFRTETTFGVTIPSTQRKPIQKKTSQDRSLHPLKVQVMTEKTVFDRESSFIRELQTSSAKEDFFFVPEKFALQSEQFVLDMESQVFKELETREAKDRSVSFLNSASQEHQVLFFSAPELKEYLPPKTRLQMQMTVIRVPTESEAVVHGFSSELKTIEQLKLQPLFEVSVSDMFFESNEVVLTKKVLETKKCQDRNFVIVKFVAEEETPAILLLSQSKEEHLLKSAGLSFDLHPLCSSVWTDLLPREWASSFIPKQTVTTTASEQVVVQLSRAQLMTEHILVEGASILIPQEAPKFVVKFIREVKPMKMTGHITGPTTFKQYLRPQKALESFYLQPLPSVMMFEQKLYQKEADFVIVSRSIKGRQIMIPFKVIETVEAFVLGKESVVKESILTEAAKQSISFPKRLEIQLEYVPLVLYSEIKLRRKPVKQAKILATEMAELISNASPVERCFQFTSSKVLPTKGKSTTALTLLKTVIQGETPTFDSLSEQKEIFLETTQSRRTSLIPVYESHTTEEKTMLSKALEAVSAKESVYSAVKRASVQLETSSVARTEDVKKIERQTAITSFEEFLTRAVVIQDDTQFETCEEFTPGQIPLKKSQSTQVINEVKAVIVHEKPSFVLFSTQRQVTMAKVESRRTPLARVCEGIPTEESVLFLKPTESGFAKESTFTPWKRTSVQLEASPFTKTVEMKETEKQTAIASRTNVIMRASLEDTAIEFEKSRELIPGQINLRLRKSHPIRLFVQIQAAVTCDNNAWTLVADERETILRKIQSRRSSLYPVYEETLTEQTSSIHQEIPSALAHPSVSLSRPGSFPLEYYILEFGQTSDTRHVSTKEATTTTDYILRVASVLSEELLFEKGREMIASEKSMIRVKPSLHVPFVKLPVTKEQFLLEKEYHLETDVPITFKSTESMRQTLVSSPSKETHTIFSIAIPFASRKRQQNTTSKSTVIHTSNLQLNNEQSSFDREASFIRETKTKSANEVFSFPAKKFPVESQQFVMDMESTVFKQTETYETKQTSVSLLNFASEEYQVIFFSSPGFKQHLPQYQTTVSIVMQQVSFSLHLEDLWFEKETVFIPHIIILGKSSPRMETIVNRIATESEAVVCCLESEKKVVDVEKTTPLLELQVSVFVTDSLCLEKEAVFTSKEYSVFRPMIMSETQVTSLTFDSHEVTLVRKPVEAFKPQDRSILLLRFASEEEDVGLLSAPECKEHVHPELASLSIVNYQVYCGIESQCILFESERDFVPQQVSVIKPVILLQATVFSTSFEENEAAFIQKTLKTRKTQDRLVIITNFAPEEDEVFIFSGPESKEYLPQYQTSVSLVQQPVFLNLQLDRLWFEKETVFIPDIMIQEKTKPQLEISSSRISTVSETTFYCSSSEKKAVEEEKTSLSLEVHASVFITESLCHEKEAVFRPQEYSIFNSVIMCQTPVTSLTFDSNEVTLITKPFEVFKTQDRSVLLLLSASEETDVTLLLAPESKEHQELGTVSSVSYYVFCGIEVDCVSFESETDFIPQEVSVIKPVLLLEATVSCTSYESTEGTLITKLFKTSKVQDRFVIISNFVPEEDEVTSLLLPEIKEKIPSKSVSVSCDVHLLFSSIQFDVSMKELAVQFTPSRSPKKQSTVEVQTTVIRVPVKVEEVVFSVSSEKRPVTQNQAAVTRVFNVLTSLVVCDQVSCEKEAVFSPSPTDARIIRRRQTMIPFRIPEVVEDLVLKKETQVNKVTETSVAKEVVYFPAKKMSIQLESSPLLQFSETTATERAKVKETMMTTKGVAQVIEDKIPFERSSEFTLASVPSKKAKSSTGVLSVKAVVQEEKPTFDLPSDRMEVSMERIESRRTSLPTVYEEVATEESELYSKPLESVSAMESVFVPAKRTSVQLETSPFTEISTTKPFERKEARSLLTTTTKKASLFQDSTQFEVCSQLIPGQMQRKQALSTKSITQMKAVMNTDTTVFTLASDQSELMLTSSQSRRSSLFPVYEEPVTAELMSTHQKLTTQLAHPLVSPSKLVNVSLDSRVREFGQTSEQKSITTSKTVPTTDLTLQFSCISLQRRHPSKKIMNSLQKK